MRKLGKLCLVFLALVALLSVLAVACGGGGDKEATPTAKATVAATAKATVAATAKATVAATAKATVAASATATVVATAKPTTSPTTSTTPTAVPTTPPTVEATIEPTPPPSAYDPTNPDIGITDTEIILGTHFSLTGIYGNAFGPVLKGMKAYFAYVNTELGGIAACGNRKVVLKVENDDYEAAKSPAAVRKLVEQEHVFAIVAGLGTAAHSAVWEYLNEKGIPDLWIMSGAHKWAADPVAHPWSYAILPDYYVEGTIFGKYISENLAGKKVGVIYQNDDYGKDELAGVKNGLDSTKNELVSEQPYDSLAIDIRAQVNKLKSDGAEVVVGGGIPGHMAQLIKGAYQMDWHPQFFIGYVNSSTAMFVYAQPYVEAMDGVLTLQGNKMDWWTDDPAIAEHHRLMATYSDENPSSNSVMGQITGETMVDVLAEACNRGDLTRQGVIDVVNSIKDEQRDLRLDGITTSFSATDHSAVEAMKFLRAHVVDGVGTYEYEGDFVSFR